MNKATRTLKRSEKTGTMRLRRWYSATIAAVALTLFVGAPSALAATNPPNPLNGYTPGTVPSQITGPVNKILGIVFYSVTAFLIILFLYFLARAIGGDKGKGGRAVMALVGALATTGIANLFVSVSGVFHYIFG